MSPGDDVMIHAPDGYHVEFSYTNVYEPQSRQGSMVLCWHCSEDIKETGERQGEVHQTYYTGIWLVFFADDSTNPDGKYVFGNGTCANVFLKRHSTSLVIYILPRVDSQ
jgi:hypothetical protein